jgi:hypothetical protein
MQLVPLQIGERHAARAPQPHGELEPEAEQRRVAHPRLAPRGPTGGGCVQGAEYKLNSADT